MTHARPYTGVRPTARRVLLTTGLAAVAVAATGLLSSALHAQATDAPAPISGGWKLNVEASQNPNGAPPPGASSGEGSGGGRGGGRSSAGFAVAGGALGREEAARFNAHVKMFVTAPPLLGIQATAKEVLLAYDPDPAKGLMFKHTADNKKHKVPTAAGEVEVKVKWNGQVLHREITTKESLKIEEDYSVSADGKQLTVKVKTSNTMVRMENVPITRVYDRTQ